MVLWVLVLRTSVADGIMFRLYHPSESKLAVVRCPPNCGLNPQSCKLSLLVLRYPSMDLKFLTTFPRSSFKQGVDSVFSFFPVRVDLQCHLLNLSGMVTFIECPLYVMLYAKYSSRRSSLNIDSKSMKQGLLLYSLTNEKRREQKYFAKKTHL